MKKTILIDVFFKGVTIRQRILHIGYWGNDNIIGTVLNESAYRGADIL